jgi:hypothetical protein
LVRKYFSLFKPPNRKLPDAIGIGAGKCGTTSLHYCLGTHPEVGVQRVKVMRFFIDSGTWHKGVDWYLRQFPSGAKVLFESHGGGYTSYPKEKGVPQRIFNLIPHARFIYLVRDPIKRMISRYIHNYSNSVENRPIEEALSDMEDINYVPQSLYFMQLQQYLRYFEPSRFLIIDQQDLLHSREQTLRKIFRFLGVREDFYSPEFEIIRHSSKSKRRNNRFGMMIQHTIGDVIFDRLNGAQRHYFKKLVYTPFSTVIQRPELSASLRKKLQDIFIKDVQNLEEFVGRKFNGWLE